MSFQIALNFEDGVTRFIECRPSEVVSDASYRQRINIPLDCRDGVCGTCKSFCESGEYELGDYVPDEAMTEDEEEAGYVLTCQMTPKSDCIIRIPATSDVAKTSIATFTGELASNETLSDTALAFTIKLDDRNRAFNTEWTVTPTTVLDGASIGANSTIVCGVTIGRFAMVAAGATVTHDVADHQLVAGTPARHLGWVDREGNVVSRAAERPQS